MLTAKSLIFIKLLLLIWAIFLAWCLIFVDRKPVAVEESTVIILDVSADMNIQDVPGAGNNHVTRMNAAKKIITKIVTDYPQRSFWLITYGSEIVYLIPPTSDSWTLLQYVDSLLASKKDGNMEKWKNATKGSPVRGKMAERNTWLTAALQGKDIIVLGDVKLPTSLSAQKIQLNTYRDEVFNLSIPQSFNVSTVQTQLLTILLCIIAILLL